MRISDWSSDVCSSDLLAFGAGQGRPPSECALFFDRLDQPRPGARHRPMGTARLEVHAGQYPARAHHGGLRLCLNMAVVPARIGRSGRSEEHTSELQSLMRISYAVSYLTTK